MFTWFNNPVKQYNIRNGENVPLDEFIAFLFFTGVTLPYNAKSETEVDEEIKIGGEAKLEPATNIANLVGALQEALNRVKGQPKSKKKATKKSS